MTTSVRTSRIQLGGAIAIGLVLTLSLVMLLRGGRDEGAAALPPDLVVEDESLDAVARTSVFFGHQSVGMNILDGIPAVYAAAGRQGPEIVESSSTPDAEAAFAHAYIGQNGDPVGKIAAFAERMRSGDGQWAGSAFLKLCFVDIVAGTDVDALFDTYRTTMAQLEDEFPETSFLHMTVPLTTEPGLKARMKIALGKGKDDPADNVAREKYNSLVRAQYGQTGQLFDVATIESTRPDGSRVSGDVDGATYFALHDGFAADRGHLNETGAQVVAAGLLDVLGESLNH